VEHYCRIVLNKALLRKMIEVANEIQIDCFQASDEAHDVIDAAEKKIFALSEQRKRKSFSHLRPILFQTMDMIDNYHGKLDGVTGVPTGYKALDGLLSGMQRSELIILAARPSMGKTAFALNMARYAAGYGVPVGIFSLEMSGPQLASRFLSSVGRIDQSKLRTGRLTDEEWGRLTVALGKLHEAPIHIDETGAINSTDLRARARRLHRQFGKLGLIVIDYLQLMSSNGYGENRATEISEISRSIKALAKELQVPIIALSQLSRKVEERIDKRPLMSDLRESGAIEQDADIIMMMYREEYYKPDTPDKGMAEVIIGKHRNGPVGTAKMTFIGEYTRFENFASGSR
jgi:replicative DNA helicase